MVGGVMFLVVLLASVAPGLIAPHDPYELNIRSKLEPPSRAHLMGTDMFGRDQFSRLVYGARISLRVGLQVAGQALVAGFLIGMLAGFYGGRVDQAIGRIVDVVAAFPWILIALVIVSIYGPGLNTALFALVIAYIPIFARITRSVVLGQRSLEYISAARIGGASNVRILFRHLLPNVIGPIVVVGSSVMAYAVLAEAALSYLGLGAQPPSASWGRLLTENSSFYLTQPHLAIFPGLAISWLVLSLNFLGDGLRDLLDPRQARMLR